MDLDENRKEKTGVAHNMQEGQIWIVKAKGSGLVFQQLRGASDKQWPLKWCKTKIPMVLFSKIIPNRVG